MTTAVPLRRLVDDEQWEAEDVAGRLGIVAHAAFLRAGFVPCGDEPGSGCLFHKQVDEIGPSAPSLSRRYTAPQLARHREGAPAPADVAVLELRAGTNGEVAFRAYLLTTDGHRRRECKAVLTAAALAPLLSGGLDDAARAMKTGSAGSWLIWKSLADLVFPVLLHEVCSSERSCFTSLPDDAKAEILKRLADGKDLARVECTSKQLQHLVAERDDELWKARYESLNLMPEAEGSAESEGLGSWKERYVNALRRPQGRRRCDNLQFFQEAEGSADDSEGLGSWKERYVNALRRCYEEWMAQRRREREAELQRFRDMEI
ncbi:hypothetical protein EJB05_35337, partial [Eragrostis curvula]